ncbi:MAG: FkbM family methyltransferase [Sulfurimonadaceae bacterium]|jgi:FkbM family methyltransferase|nr:FkbM family methyltransferase [Sulfurimonadaceae bacterium]
MINRIKITASKFLPKIYQRLRTIKRAQSIKKFQKEFPQTQLFYPVDKEKRKFYSQDNQDFIVYENFFKNKKDGFFCDIGGNHPQKLNNTLYFEEQGWSGIAFEPLQHMNILWKEHRKAKLFSVALSNSNDKAIFTIVKDTTGWEDMLSFVKETRDVDYGYETQEIEVQTKRLQDIVEQENIKVIDYLSLDVEGHELNVLQGIDFDKVRINVLTIENNPPSHILYGDTNIRDLMIKNDYVLWGRIIGLDDIYVHKDFLAKEVE